MKTFATILACVKIMIAMPCLMWGLFVGVIGLGADGFVPLDSQIRIIAVCIFLGALAAACPIALGEIPKPLGWLAAVLSALPLGLGLRSVWIWGWASHYQTPSENTWFLFEATMFVLFPILSIADLLLSYKLKAQVKDA